MEIEIEIEIKIEIEIEIESYWRIGRTLEGWN